MKTINEYSLALEKINIDLMLIAHHYNVDSEYFLLHNKDFPVPLDILYRIIDLLGLKIEYSLAIQRLKSQNLRIVK